MIRSLIPLAGIAVALIGSRAAGDDVPAGADTLPYLYGEATLVVVAEKAQTLDVPPSARAAAYRVTVREGLRGETARGAELNVLIARDPGAAGDALPAEKFASAIVFLRKIQEKDLGYWWGTAERPGWLSGALVVVSGKQGVVPADPEAHPKRLSLVRDYITAKSDPDPKALLGWAERCGQADPGCPFIARSAVAEVANFVRQAKPVAEEARRSRQLLDASLKSQAADAHTKATALAAYRHTVSSESAALRLSEFATDKTNPLALRQQAVREAAAAVVTGGTEVPDHARFLKLFEASPEAKSYAEKLVKSAPARVAIGSEDLKKLTDLIRGNGDKPGDRENRLAAVRAAAGYGYSDQLADLLTDTARNHPDEVERAEAVRSLATWNNSQAAARIASLVKDDKAPDSVRHAGLMGLGQMDKAVAGPVLKTLAEELPKSKFKTIAAALSASK
jgi:hypothetical protein